MESEDDARDNTLIALTTHFAKVQFRLKQIVSADSQRKEELLRELEAFAFQGCPGSSMTYDTAAAWENGSTEAQQQRRSDLMERLKDQLRDLEECARSVEGEEGGGKGGGTNLAHKQHLIIEELRRRFDLQFGDLESMSTEEMKEEVSKAVKGMESKKDLVTQLTTQVSDLHRYIAYLREDPLRSRTVGEQGAPLRPSLRFASPLTSGQTKHVSFADEEREEDSSSSSSGLPQFRPLHTTMVASRAFPDTSGSLLGDLSDSGGVQCSVDSNEMGWMRDSNTPLYQCKAPDDLRLSLLVMRKTLSVMQMLTLWQCGGSFQCLPRYVADGHRKRYHSALRSLEVAVDRIAILTTSLSDPGLTAGKAVTLETELHEEVSMSLADSLRVLLEHGLINGGGGAGPGKSCVSVWGHAAVVDEKDCAGWKVFQFYYGLKNGRDYSTKPDQLLSSSFSLPIGSSTSSIKKTLLAAIYRVENTYVNCRNMSRDTKFRALVCEGFNLCHLAEWFRIVATHPTVADELYTASSFLASTGFRPAIACLENLKDNPPCHPVELPSDYYHSPNAFQTSN